VQVVLVPARIEARHRRHPEIHREF
jgi:hypothetical protein